MKPGNSKSKQLYGSSASSDARIYMLDLVQIVEIHMVRMSFRLAM